MAALNLFLLGGFELCSSAGAPVIVAAKKAKALLAYLAVSAGRAHSRDKLAALLWEERDEAQARHNLRQALASCSGSQSKTVRTAIKATFGTTVIATIEHPQTTLTATETTITATRLQSSASDHINCNWNE